MDKKNNLRVIAWGLGALVLALAAIVWMQSRLGHGKLTVYAVFPLLGLSAFSLLWTHYIVGSSRRMLAQDKKVLETYTSVTGWLVLALILLHPGLLWYQLWRDGLGLPPKSYLTVYPPTQHLALIMGSVSLLIFLSFESKKFFQKKQWWKYIEYLQVIAMGLIFYHALTLGGELRQPWFRLVWWLYGLSLVTAVIYSYRYDRNNAKEKIA